MKLATALYFLTFSSCAIAAPVSTGLDKAPGRADLSNSGPQQEPRIKLPIKTPILQPSKAAGKKGSKPQGIQSSNDQRQLSSDGVAKSSPENSSHKPKKPKSSYLASLAHRLTNKPPFSESSIVREETRASTGDWEPEATIVEWETKASREATIWLPCFTTDKTLHYHRIRVNTDMLVVSLVLTFVVVVLVIELWKPVATRIRRFQSGHGAIHLDIDAVTRGENLAEKPSMPYEPIAEGIAESKQEASKVGMVTTKS
ncbi:hypothetical protein GQX73_g2658 [Xylaria multiplex]|uniref:Transmembrane protein n=1 Tax=Xylaria multiplex TaxID=323545 RepID=A0A7C8IYL6_9PEZI|nr:hypothetical protein GQX73_g2658 [Xylaria multiplex]